MLAIRGTRVGPLSRPLASRYLIGRHETALPSSRRFFIPYLCEGFLDLAIAIPLPPSVPPYSTAIILVALVTRLALLPIAIWGKRRSQRIEEIVLPQIERLKPAVQQRVLQEMKASGVRGDKMYLKEAHTKRTIELLTALRRQLFKEHRCHPLPSVLFPVLSQIPVFVLISVTLSRLSVDPTPFDSESFLTLTSLSHPDPTMTLPILLGVFTMANVESGNWVMTTAERERIQRIKERRAKKRVEGGPPNFEPRQLIQSGLRLLSIGRIVFASIMPGCISLYWVTSATLGLIQTWVTDWWMVRRKRSNAHSLGSSAATSSSNPS